MIGVVQFYTLSSYRAWLQRYGHQIKVMEKTDSHEEPKPLGSFMQRNS